MTAINLPNLENLINCRVNQTTTLCDAQSILVNAVSAAKHRNVVDSVGKVSDLPDIYKHKIPNGYLIYVDFLNDFVISSNGSWVTLGKVTVRDDAPTFTAFGWGLNNCGQLGDNTITSRLSPVSVVGGFTDWRQVSAGLYHTAAIRTDGTLWTWGLNSLGQLGDNTTVSKSSPVSIVGGVTDWCDVSAGLNHTAAIRTNGTLWTWGSNGSGQLGDNTVTTRSSPVSVVGGFTDWCQVSAGGDHTAAVRSDGTLWTWGLNTWGQLGDNTAIARSSPVSDVSGFTDWCQVSAACSHTAAVRTNGTIWTWGSNGLGRLGDNTTISRSSPVSIVGELTDWCRVSAGGFHTAAIRTDGTLWTWGSNNSGRLGNNAVTDRSSPVSVVGGFTDWCQVSASALHTAAIRTNGTLWSWGLNTAGLLGDNSIIARSSPVSVVGGFTGWCQVSAGSKHTSAIRSQLP